MLNQCLLAVLVTVHVALGYQTFQDNVPNGANVPNPCGDGNWDGVGHLLQGGTGTLNPFGEDFRSNNFEWSVSLCLKDSDGDGRTNGQELGDPDCDWLKAHPIDLDAATGHPGICEPLNDPVCASSTFTC